jgi:hypothetical protein
MFQLTPAEADGVRGVVSPPVPPSPGVPSNSSQTVISPSKHRGRSYGNGRNVALRDITTFPTPASLFTDGTVAIFRRLFSRLMADFKKHSAIRKRSDGVEFQEFYPSRSKPLLDEIDTMLAQHYGFTPQELDFILNYDIKYRLGREAELAG